MDGERRGRKSDYVIYFIFRDNRAFGNCSAGRLTSIPLPFIYLQFASMEGILHCTSEADLSTALVWIRPEHSFLPRLTL
ncbi:hypothetical protein N7478_004234 [Penicillium angulare]|uniref:uncharacterized protein n=1 Tax=Penicillium angulare TaxID=116970 RepID=UPI002541FCC1|nr:uncharacterized protein N7478_004234 [Penicillium angulare]KAJ5278862.1 hypothetical protein N7478_004234 [Penicillium angulare]